MTEENRAPATKRTLINVPLFHVTGEVPVMLNSFVISRTMVMMAKWDAGRGASADRKGGHHLLRRRADHEPRADEPSGPGQIRSVVADRHRSRRRAEAREPCRAPGAGVSQGAARARLRTDRNERRRLLQLLGQLRRQAGFDRPRAEAIRGVRDPRRGRRASAHRRTRRDRDQVGREHQMLLGRSRSDRAPPSRPTATSAPATSAMSTRTAICSSSTARRTSSSAAARISPAPRSRRRSTPAPRSPRPAFSECRTTGWARCRSPSIYPHEADELTDEDLKAFLEPRISAFKIPARFIFADEPLPKLGTGKIDRVAIKAQYRN